VSRELRPETIDAPVAPGERLPELDAVRGVALLGILAVNGIDYVARPGSGVDEVVAKTIAFLATGKFYPLFSFLFGIGIGLLSENGRRARSGALLLRRHAILLGFALLQYLLLEARNILIVYAVAGALLVLVSRIPRRFLLAAAAAALLVAVAWPRLQPRVQTAAIREAAVQARAEYLEARRDGDFATTVASRAALLRPALAGADYGEIAHMVSMMLLGIWAVRRGVVTKREGSEQIRARAMRFGLPLGLLATAFAWYAPTLVAGSNPPFYALVRVALFAGASALALGYGAAAWELARRSPAGRTTATLAAAGRMALTNFLLQSVFLSLVYFGYGLGMERRLGAAPALALGLAFFIAQALASRAWLAAYRFGPLEWLWRSATYGRRQTMRRRSGQRETGDPGRGREGD
jgi:uncharacterized protein